MKTLILAATTSSIEAKMSGSASSDNPDFVVAFADNTGSAFTEGSQDGTLNGTSTVTVCAAPSASTRRIIKSINFHNTDDAEVTITLIYNSNSTLRTLATIVLGVNERWSSDDNPIFGERTVDVVSNVASSTILGRTTGGTGNSEELSPSALRTLINVEDGATADQDISGIGTNSTAITNIETKTDFISVTQNVDLDTMESNIATNNSKVSYTDGTKVAGIEAGADVTDTANVTSAGALMDSELTSIADVKALDQSVVSGASPTFAATNMTDGTDKNFISDAEAVVLGNTSNTNTGDEVALIASEINTGTDTDKYATADALAGSYVGTARVVISVTPDNIDVVTGDNQARTYIPTSVGGMNLVGVHAYVVTAGTTNTTDVQIHNLTQAADMLSTVSTIDSGETSSRTAATPAVIDTANDDVAAGDIIRIDIDAASTVPPEGLYIELEFRLP